MPGGRGRSGPTPTRAGHRYVQLIQQPPQPHTAICAPAMLDVDAARMARLIGDDHHATAPGTHGISNRIHEDNLGAPHDRRERSPDAGSYDPRFARQTVVLVAAYRSGIGQRASDHITVAQTTLP